jgi:5-methylthioadenosine/S-adenosylhomocysteine deaminase
MRVRLVLCAALAAWIPITASGREKADIVVSGATVVPMDNSGKVLRDGAIAIAEGRIAGVGPAEEIRARYSAGRLIDGRG